ncbi:MAG: hypothetical protein BJBARM5_0581 [Candidatus Parvarchaeum acidophilus ARMAN-5]|jgi:hypothetical protein|uniref:Uncharacterized protein n=1 Tax=Candidatus Parvarchaeum acidophilus ARMAN-5 TaxID=662762 RepID=D6GVR8_PARA5|nr:MAG: hypothetical protein BJBARM5_0581 [Candidatus Parvarchaeum acidophilus ARMAN-5]
MRNKSKKESFIWKPWRMRLLKDHLLTTLIIFEFIISTMFFLLSYFTDNIYFKGVGVGLLISWVTSTIAYFIRKKKIGS